MELRPGYKQTELGAFPSDWECRELGSLDPFVTSGSRGWAEFYADFGSAFIRITNMSRESIYLDLSDLKCVALAPQSSEGTRTALQPGDLLVSITADIGIISFIDGSVPVPAYINQHIALVRFADHQVDPKYIAYFLAAEASQRAFRASTDQGAKAGMNLEEVRKVRAVLPPANEQRAIAGALSEMDALLAKLDQIIAKKRDLKQGAMQQLLTGQTRLPGFSGEWVVKRFGEVAAPRRERIDPRTARVQTFCVELEHIEPGSGQLLGSGSTSEQSSLKSVFQAGDVLVGKLRAYLRKYWLADRPGVCSTEIWALAARGNVVAPAFLFQLVMSDRFTEAASTAYGTHMPRSDWNIVKVHEFPIPSIDEQTAIASVLADIDAELSALEARRDKTRALKQGMMQALLTGRIRLV